MPMVSSIVGTVLSLVLISLCIYTFGFGLNGIPLALFIQSSIVLATTMTYSFCKPEVRKCLQPFNSDSFDEWMEYIKVSSGNMIMICGEWWAFEVLTIMAGFLGVMELAAQTICFNVSPILFMIPVAMSSATCALMGNSIGANNIPLAQRFLALTWKITLLVVVILALTVIFTRRFIVSAYTQDEELIEMAASVLIITGCNYLGDGMQGYLQGPIRALHLQRKASYVSIVCMWLLGLPLAATFAFACDFGVRGLLMGFLAATAL